MFVVDGKQLAVLIQAKPGHVSLEKLRSGEVDLNLFVMIHFNEIASFLGLFDYLANFNIGLESNGSKSANNLRFYELALNKETYNKAFSQHILQ